VTPERGAPLAVALRNYGRHSVAGYPVLTPAGYVEREVRDLIDQPTPLPTIAAPRAALREGCDLAIVACRAESVPGMLQVIAAAAADLTLVNVPTVVVTPTGPATLRNASHPRRLRLGYAPFDYRPQHALARLLNLSGIVITPHTPDDAPALHDAATQAWKWVNNYTAIKIREPRWTSSTLSR
jgi:hypothetical protein